MKAKAISAARELAALRQQLEALTQQVRLLEQRFESESKACPVERPSAPAIPWLVITAAVAAVVKGPHRIVSLEMPGLPPLNLWSIEGRRAVFHSHRLR